MLGGGVILKIKMKKDKIKIGNIEVEYTRSGVFKLFELYYKKECNSDRVNELEDTLSKIETIEDKIQYCKDILEQYYTYLDPSTFAVSGMTMAQGIFPNDTKIFFDKIIQIRIGSLEAELKNQKNIGKRKKYIYKEIALAYILGIYAEGKTIPKAPQGNAKKVLENIGESEFNVKGDSFYRAVKDILNVYDVNIEVDLNQISKNWYNAIKEISTKRNKWDSINEYLKTKGIPKG